MYGTAYSYEIYLNGNALDIRLDGISVEFYQGEEAVLLSEKLEEAQEEGQDAINKVCMNRYEIIDEWYTSLLGGAK